MMNKAHVSIKQNTIDLENPCPGAILDLLAREVAGNPAKSL